MMGRCSSSRPSWVFFRLRLAGESFLIGGVLPVASDEDTDFAGRSLSSIAPGALGRIRLAESRSLR